jgi:signal transduction histidine kinase
MGDPPADRDPPHVHVVVADDGDKRALADLLSKRDYRVTTGDEVAPADCYVVDEYALPAHREALRAEKRSQDPVFCPVVLVHRASSRLVLDEDDTAPRAIDDSVVAPVDAPVFFRRLSNLLDQRRHTQELAERNERLSAFASKVSHELRNPLNVLDGRLSLAAEEVDSEHFADMQRSVDRMHRLVADILSLARSGEVDVDPEPVELRPVAQSCWRATGTDVATLRVETDATVVADEDRLYQLFSNLFRNAVEHAGRNVTVTVGDLSDGFYVADDGPGIPAGDRDAVMQQGVTNAEHGTGLGLSVVAEVVAAHDWTVSVVESDGGGARFDIRGVQRPADGT